MTWIADYSFARPDLAALKQAGCSGIARYAVDVPGAGHKAVDAAEIGQARSLGLTVVAVMETVAQPALRGFQGGVADATAANLRLDQLGNYPRDCWLYYAAEDPNRLPQSAWPTVVSYFQGVATVGGRPAGGYGGVALLDHLGQAGLISRKWAVEYWGGHNGCHLSQYDYAVPPPFTSMIDANAVIQDDYGQHPRPGGAQDVPLDANDQQWLTANILQPLAAQLDHAFGLLLYGDSPDAAAGKTTQGHPFNLYQLWGELVAVKAELDAVKAAVAAIPTSSLPVRLAGSQATATIKFG